MSTIVLTNIFELMNELIDDKSQLEVTNVSINNKCDYSVFFMYKGYKMHVVHDEKNGDEIHDDYLVSFDVKLFIDRGNIHQIKTKYNSQGEDLEKLILTCIEEMSEDGIARTKELSENLKKSTEKLNAFTADLNEKYNKNGKGVFVNLHSACFQEEDK